MTRRALFSTLAAAVLDPECLLWRPGRKLISIPKPVTARDLIIRGSEILARQSALERQLVTLNRERQEGAMRALNAMIDRWNSEPRLLIVNRDGTRRSVPINGPLP